MSQHAAEPGDLGVGRWTSVGWLARAAGAVVLAVVAAACSPPDAGSDPVAVETRTGTASPTSTAATQGAETTDATEVVSTEPAPDVDDDSGAVPAALVGTWQSVDQGSAEDLIEIHADGTYVRAMVLMQQRPSGMFTFSIGTKGNVEVQGTTLRVEPSEGTESLTDPDSPSGTYTDRPTDLTPQEFQWAVSGGSLFLQGEFGLVEFRPST